MNAGEQIKRFEEFFETYYKDDISENLSKGLHYILFDFKNLASFDITLSEQLLDSPEETFRAAEISVKQMDLGKIDNNFRVRVKNIPDSQKILIRDLRSKHINKLVKINGLVGQKTEIRPIATTIRYECPACGNVISVMQLEKTIKEPTRCGCGRKGRFKILSEELVDFQGMESEELTVELDGGTQPQRMKMILQHDLVSPINDRKTMPGTNICVIGILQKLPIEARNGSKLTRYDLCIKVNYFEPLEEDLYNLKISDKDVLEIKRLSKDKDIFNKLSSSFAPSIYGYQKIKEALVLQVLGGVQKINSDGSEHRGDIHILLIGDPGSGKSQLLKRCQIVTPKSRKASGKGASGSGLTASAVKNEFLGGWSLEAGLLPLCHKGVAIIDELDKMNHQDRDAMHEALEEQTCTVNKAGIHAVLPCETTVLAAANPKFSRFDPYGIVAEQINLPASLINRFDLIFPIRDKANTEDDWRKASFVSRIKKKCDVPDVEIDTPLLRKYLAYARQNIKPRLTNAVEDKINSFWVKLRNNESVESGSVRSVPVNMRILDALYRLAEASAKARLSNIVNVSDAKRAIDIMHSCMSQIGIDPQTGKIDMDKIETGMTTSKRGMLTDLKKAIDRLTKKIGNMIPIDDLIKEADSYGIDEADVEEGISKLKRSGDIFEPKRGFIQKI